MPVQKRLETYRMLLVKVFFVVVLKEIDACTTELNRSSLGKVEHKKSCKYVIKTLNLRGSET